MNNELKNDGSIGLLGILTIIFIVLKLTGNIFWSWFWVLSPTLIPLILILIAVGVGGISALIWRIIK